MVFISLMLSAALNAGLAMYQWFELITVRRGGSTVCSVNETVNCATVWNSPFASAVHDTLGIPVAGLGLVWSFTALFAAFIARYQHHKGQPVDRAFTTVRIVAAVGALSVLIFVGASVAAKAVCLTCLGTYALTLTYAGLAFFALPAVATGTAVVPAGAIAAMLASVSFLFALPLGLKTPKAAGSAVTGVAADQVKAFITGLGPQEKQLLADALAEWQRAPVVEASDIPIRDVDGNADAPVKLVDFTDVKCSHCRNLDLALAEMRRMLGNDAFSLESRQYPLDGECNPSLKSSWGDGVRCLGAKMQICLEKNPNRARVRHSVFENQSALGKEKLFELTLASGISREQLDACLADEQTNVKLRDDVRYADRFKIDGTPLVLLNGKEVKPIPPLLLALIAAGGDVKSPLFAELPPPSPVAPGPVPAP